MRLIDVDNLVVDARLGENEIPFVSHKQIKDAPTIEAIPVEFIKEQMRKYEELAYNSIPKIQQRYFDKEAALKTLINDWHKKNGEKENE